MLGGKYLGDPVCEAGILITFGALTLPTYQFASAGKKQSSHGLEPPDP